MVLGFKKGSRNQGKAEAIRLGVFCGGGPPKKPPKSKVFGSRFASLKIRFFLFLVVFLFTQRTNEIEEGLKQPHNIHIIPGGFEFVATTACF